MSVSLAIMAASTAVAFSPAARASFRMGMRLDMRRV